jgi:hypothetical protein
MKNRRELLARRRLGFISPSGAAPQFLASAVSVLAICEWAILSSEG